MMAKNYQAVLKLLLNFEKDGDFEMTYKYSYSYGGQSYSYTDSYEGEWEWDKDKEEIEIQMDGSSYTTDWEITRLTNSELWFEDENGDDYEFEKK